MGGPLRRFFGLPTRGGILSMANCALWLLVTWNMMTEPSPLIGVLALFLSLPAALPFILPTLGDRSDTAAAGLVMACLMIGVNSFGWGYGISGLLSLMGFKSSPGTPLDSDQTPPNA